MYYKEFIELNLPIGTKVRYKDSEWLYLGMGSNDSGNYIQLAQNDRNNGHPNYDYLASWHNEEIEVIEYPTKYMSIAKYHVGDIVYYFNTKIMILQERDDDGDYFVFNYFYEDTCVLSEEQISLEPTKIPSDEIKEETKEKGE